MSEGEDALTGSDLLAQVEAFNRRLPGHWIEEFDPVTMDRGMRHFHAGKVEEIRIGEQAGQLMVTAEVAGGRKRRYQIQLLLHQERQGLWSLIPICTCPVGFACEHTAALLIALRALEQTAAAAATTADTVGDRSVFSRTGTRASADPALPPIWEQLFEELAGSLEPAAAPAWPEQQRLAFLFAPSRGLPPALLAGPILVRPGKRAGYIGARSLPEQPAGTQPWSQAQFELIAALRASPLEQHKPVLLHRSLDAHQDAAIERALATELCFFERAADGVLSLGAERSMQWFWTDQPDGGQRIDYRIAGCPRGQLLLGHGLWYFDPGTMVLGRISESRYRFELLHRLPDLAAEHVQGVARRLPALPGPSLPAPSARPPIERLVVAPRAVLILRQTTWMDWRNARGTESVIAIGRLRFDYAGLRCDARFRPNERRYQDQRLTEVVRDQAAEQLLQQELAQLLWLPISRCTVYLAGSGPDDFIAITEAKRVVAIEAMPARLAQLRAAGILIEYESSYPHHRLLVAEQWSAEVSESGSDWFDLSLGVEVEGQRHDLLPILRAVIADDRFPRQPVDTEPANATWTMELDAERKLVLPLARLRALVDPLWEWLEQSQSGLRLRRSQAHVLMAIEGGARLPWQGGQKLRQVLAQLAAGPAPVRAPKGFKTELRPYQRDGLAWLNHLATAELGGVLADDMGLGKTVQVLAHLLDLKNHQRLDRPALVIAPTSLVGNWKAEAERFAPQLRVLVIHGLDRAGRFEWIGQHDLVITTYPLLQRDRDQLLQHEFSLLILDEAQAIKNARSQAAGVVRELRAARRLGMTGTPLENHLGELWAQFDAVEPGLLGDERQFTRLFRTPIEKHQDADKQRRLNARIAPLMLRRRKQDVLSDLPDKTEITRAIEIEGGQRELYETLRLAQHQRVQQAIAERGLAQSGIVVLDALLKLRQCCCDPRLVKLTHAKKVDTSAKLDALLDLLDSLLSEGRRVLVFSQFAEMLGLISTALSERQIVHQQLTGDTPSAQRTGLVANFQNGAVGVFLISLKAGGVGLNLTAADTVIHYDPWWNPAVEAQATDRAHRIGQDKAVFVYKLICAGTVEEKIQAMQARKSELARAVLDGGGVSTSAKFNASDLAELFAPL